MNNTVTIDQVTGRPLRRLTVRLPDAVFEELREAAFRARLRPAEAARTMILTALKGEVPARPKLAPPTPLELSEDAQRLLSACKASISNLSQIGSHASEIGHPQAPALNAELARISNVLRTLGLTLKSGQPVPTNAAQIEIAAEQVNSLARSLNQDSRSVSPRAWNQPLGALRASLASLAPLDPPTK